MLYIFFLQFICCLFTHYLFLSFMYLFFVGQLSNYDHRSNVVNTGELASSFMADGEL
jgi:hypothetical protein